MDLPVLPPVRPMLAKSVKGVPAPDSVDGGLSYEPKWDGTGEWVNADTSRFVVKILRNLATMTGRQLHKGGQMYRCVPAMR